MNLLLTKSSEVAKLRKGESISHEDLLFLLRKNKVKMKRLLQYLNIKDAKEVLNRPSKLTELVRNPANGKRVKKCLKFLNMIDNIFMYEDILEDDIPDPTMTSRNERKFNMVSSMSIEEYMEFKNTQTTSFFPKGGGEEFSAWLLEDGVTDKSPSSFALEIINYFARETICEIIDLVMKLRKEKISSTPDVPSSVTQLVTKTTEKTEGNETPMEEDSSTNESTDAITVFEIQEAMRRYVKLYNRNELFYNENLDVLIPDGLLCC